MKVAVGSDERNQTTDAVVALLRDRGIEVELNGPLRDETHGDSGGWAEVSELRLTTPVLAREIVDAFLDTHDVDDSEVGNIERVKQMGSR